MKKILSAQLSLDSTRLKQMGGNVKIIQGKTCYVKFDVDGITVSYVYNLNKKGKYFLERILPYALPIKEFDEESIIVDLIQTDLEQFRNAVKSHNIKEFIDVSKEFNLTIKRFEDLYLYYNVPEDKLKLIHKNLDEINSIIEITSAEAARVFTEKEPDNL